MTMSKRTFEPALDHCQQAPAIRFLVESALRKVAAGKQLARPKSDSDWIDHLAVALCAKSDVPFTTAVAALMATGVGRTEFCSHYIPAVARRIGEFWVSDQTSFVDVTVGTARLQRVYREHRQDAVDGWRDRSVPLGHAVLMVIPKFEQHSLGAFVAADDMRRLGAWVHMAIDLDAKEIANVLRTNRFAMVGLTLATPKSVELSAELVDCIRGAYDGAPPIVAGGRAISEVPQVLERSGVDIVARTAREAMERCGLATGREMSAFEPSF